VVLETQKHGETEAVRWESTGDGTYTVERIPARPRGTAITLHLRPQEDAPEEGVAPGQDFADPWTIRSLVKKYSDFIAFPIVMENEKWEGDEKKLELETLNSGKALWTRPAGQVTAEEHAEFYKHLTHDWNEPGETVHFHAEGAHEWSALLYLPKKAPFDLFSRDPRRGLSLYIKRVFISDEVKELIPEHFRFVRGLVDSADLPLNVSRETVQHDRLLPVIKKRIAGKLVSHLKDVLEKERERYAAFWAEFGNCVKEGFHYEPAAKDKLAELVLVHTTAGSGLSSLAEVAARKQEGQTALWYLTGDKLDVLQHSPHLEVFRKKGVEVILLPDAVDEIMVGQLDKFGDLELKSAAKGELDGLPDAETDAAQPQPAEFEAVMAKLKDVLKDDVSEVRLSQRLTDSAVCLVAAEDGMSPQMVRMMAAMGQAMPPQKRVLELNGQHAAIAALRGMVDSDGERFQDYAEMLLDQALLAEGSPVRNPARFAQRVAAVMARAAG
jgi:molecular chaperone HtpG